MSYENEMISARLSEWVSGMEQFQLPDWEKLPPLELYMDQVIILLKQYLSPLYPSDDEKAITASIINNYVRMKVMPPPVKKKYARVHLAYLIMICLLKQSLSISCIQRMLPSEKNEEDVKAVYNNFVEQYHTVCDTFIHATQRAEVPSLPNPCENFLISCAILSSLSTGLTEFLLYEKDAKPPK
ncbi:MAG: DUF1836 domain-containing protein [Oscillospiraceae bacterium]|nr:DUF1836 domain-containing protein [Oscillospiraceae bacterium]